MLPWSQLCVLCFLVVCFVVTFTFHLSRCLNKLLFRRQLVKVVDVPSMSFVGDRLYELLELTSYSHGDLIALQWTESSLKRQKGVMRI